MEDFNSALSSLGQLLAANAAPPPKRNALAEPTDNTGLFEYLHKGILGATGLNPQAGEEQRRSPGLGTMAYNSLRGLANMPGEIYHAADRLTQATTGRGFMPSLQHPLGTPTSENQPRDTELPSYNALPDVLTVAGAMPVGGLLSAGARGGESVGMGGGALSRGGLDMSHEARMARAKEQGFNLEVPYYRGSTADETHARPNTWVAGTPEYANAFARGDGSNVAKVFVRGKHSPGEWSLSPEEAARAGFDGRGAPDGNIQVFDPSNIRSVNAAFDPAKRDSANILASNPATAAPMAGVGQDQDFDAQLAALSQLTRQNALSR